MEKQLAIEFLKRLPAKAECVGEEPFAVSKHEKLYPWLTLGKLPFFIPCMDANVSATIRPDATGFTLVAGYASKWTTLVAVLTGGIGSSLLSGWLHREESVRCDGKSIKRVVRAVEKYKDWPWKTSRHLSEHLTRVVYLVSAEFFGTLYAHVFSLKTPRHYYAIRETFEQYKEDQTTLDGIVHTAIHTDRAEASIPQRKCPACGTPLRPVQVEVMLGNPQYQPWCREGYCSLACYKKLEPNNRHGGRREG